MSRTAGQQRTRQGHDAIFMDRPVAGRRRWTGGDLATELWNGTAETVEAAGCGIFAGHDREAECIKLLLTLPQWRSGRSVGLWTSVDTGETVEC
jgi:hypothetical protein